MAGQLTIDTLKASTGVLATQNGMTGIAKAWVNINGASGASPTIRASFNVSSVTRSSAGVYVINFTTAMPDANYSATGSTIGSTAGATFVESNDTVLSTTSCTIGVWSAQSSTRVDRSCVCFTVSGN